MFILYILPIENKTKTQYTIREQRYSIENGAFMEVKVKSLEKAMKILECFTVKEPELGITEISVKLDLNKSNVHNIISTFEKMGYVEKKKENDKYKLGLKIMRLSHVLSTTMPFHNIVHRCLTELSAKIDEIVYFGIPNGDHVIYLEGAFPDKLYNTRWVQGMSAPFVCTGIGKAMLAYMEEDFVETLLTKPLTKYTDFTITDPDQLKEELKLIRARGYSIDNMEHEYGVKCVGVPVLNDYGELIGALSTTGPSLRFDEEQSALFALLLKEKAAIIGRSV